MNVVVQYPGLAMNSPPKTRFDDGGMPVPQSRGKPNSSHNARFDDGPSSLYPEFYDYSDDDTVPRSASASGNMAMQVPAPSQMQQRLVPIPQQQQPPSNHGPPEPSRPPVTNNGLPQRGGHANSRPQQRPPSYSGSRSEEYLVGGSEKHRGQNRRQRPVNDRPQSSGRGAALPSSNEPDGLSPRHSPGRSPSRRASGGPQKQHRPVSPESITAGRTTSDPASTRLKTPCVMKSVLLPLEQKIAEYSTNMQEAQDLMQDLDGQLRALQERKAEAENRFMDAKSRHDDYQRQYHDVERALRGEGPAQRDMREMPIAMPRRERAISIEEDPIDRRPVSHQSSFGAQMRKRDRFRMSIFGNA